MNPIDPTGSATRLPHRVRLLLVGGAAGLIALLVIAAMLQPSPTGTGTHLQLGLPPCGFQWFTGLRCPTCGMTTSWSYAVRGQWSEAVGANAGGLLLALLAATAAAGALAVAAAGQRWDWLINKSVAIAVGVTVASVTLVDWLTRVWSFYFH